jgi:hypothetical protein
VSSAAKNVASFSPVANVNGRTSSTGKKIVTLIVGQPEPDLHASESCPDAFVALCPSNFPMGLFEIGVTAYATTIRHY